MQQYQLRQMGGHHDLHCEDDLLLTSLGNDRWLMAVMDGCTMGTDSHLPSTLCAKLLRKTATEMDYEFFRTAEQSPLEDQLREIVEGLHKDLRYMKNFLQLETNELLCTLVLAVVDLRARRAEVVAIGDGWVDCNGVGHEFEQGNRPDYIGYHLSEAFGDWWASQRQRLSLRDVRDLSICSDGILSFHPVRLGAPTPEREDALVPRLLRVAPGASQAKFLQAQLKEIREVDGLAPADDLTILRMVW